MSSYHRRFGDVRRFEIAVRWLVDTEPRERLPLDGGWSTGELRITAGNQVLTRHILHGQRRDYFSWYLAPVIEWLISNWTWLLHEEHFAWENRLEGSAARATFAALERTIASQEKKTRREYADVHAWWSRHALQAADSGDLYPDIYFRRLGDDIEVSWLPRQPEFAPEGFLLELEEGRTLLPVVEVAGVLWEFLKWAVESAPVQHDNDRAMLERFRDRLQSLQNTPLGVLEQASVGLRIQTLLESARKPPVSD